MLDRGTPSRQRTRRPTQNDRILALLQAGPKTTHEILRHVPCIVHSRVAELRERGHSISCRRDGDNYVYTLHTIPPEGVEATTTPEGRGGWDEPRHPEANEAMASRPPLSAATDAIPEGVRAETPLTRQDSGGDPGNAPNAADDLLDEPDTGLPEGGRSPSLPSVPGSSSGPSVVSAAYEAPTSRSSVRGAPDDARSTLSGNVGETCGHGPQGDPGCAEAKSSPEFRPETPARPASDDARSALTLFPVQQGAYGDVAA